MFIFGVIPARGGSKGLPGKNLKTLAGRPMIGWTISAARQSRELSLTWVSTENAAIADAARAMGAEVPFLRPEALAKDDSSIFAVIRHAVEELKTRRGTTPDVVVLLQPTSPLRGPEQIDAVVRLVRDGADSAQTVALDETHPRHRFTLKDGRLTPFWTDPDAHSRRQEGEPVYRPNGAVYAARLPVLLETGGLRGRDHRGLVMDFESSVDVDGEWDFRLAEMIAQRRGLAAKAA